MLDTAVFQTNRIDYCAPAILRKTLETEEAQAATLWQCALVVGYEVALPELTAVEETEYKRRVSHAKAAMKDTATEIRAIHPRALCRIGGPGHS